MITIAPIWSNPPHPTGQNSAGEGGDSGMPFFALLKALPVSADDTANAPSTISPEILAMSPAVGELPGAVMDFLASAQQPVASGSIAFSNFTVFGRQVLLAAGPEHAGEGNGSGMPIIAQFNPLPASASDTENTPSTNPSEIFRVSPTVEELPGAVMDMLAAARQPIASRSFAFSDLGVFGRQAPFAMADSPQDGVRTIGQEVGATDALPLSNGTVDIISGGKVPSSADLQSNTNARVMEQAPDEFTPPASTDTQHFSTFALTSNIVRVAITTPDGTDPDIGGALPAVLVKTQAMRPSPVSLTITEGENAVSIAVRCANLSADTIQVLKRQFADVARDYGVNLSDFFVNGSHTNSTISLIEGAGHGRPVG